MKDGSSLERNLPHELSEVRVGDELGEVSPEEARQRAARKIAVETKKLWREAQSAGLDDLARLMEESFYRAYQQAGGPKAMRAV